MCNGEPIATQSIKDKSVSTTVQEITFADDRPLEDIMIRDSMYHPEPFAAYYVRVEQGDGSHQWTSPIWIDRE
jgi:hypothetical protein